MTDDFDPRPAERAFALLVQRRGRPGPALKRLDLQPPLAEDGETDCWSHAWDLARRIGARYVEGICQRGHGLAQHAWVEEDSPFGPRLVECTPGYEDAYNYIGIQVDCSPGGQVEEITSTWADDPDTRLRVSVIQAALAGGVPPETVLEIVQPVTQGG